MLEYKIGSFLISMPPELKVQAFDEEDYRGIIFYYERYRYEVLKSRLGTRLLINGREGEMRDIPFNMKTANMLPDFVKVEIIE
jgi:hypothetical protein